MRSLRDGSPAAHETYTDGYPHKLSKNIKKKIGEKKDVAEFRVRSASSSKKYRYNKEAAPGITSPGHKITSGKKKKKKLLKGNYGERQTLPEKEVAHKVSGFHIKL